MKLLSGPELADQWHIIKPQIEEAIVHGSGVVTSHGLFLQCLGAVGQCWVRDEGGVCITRFEEIEGKKAVSCSCLYISRMVLSWTRVVRDTGRIRTSH